MTLAAQQMHSARHTSGCTTKILGSAIALRRHSWLRSIGQSDENKTQIEQMPFEGESLFHPTMNDLMEDHQKKTDHRKACQSNPSASTMAILYEWKQPTYQPSY
ncbi:hypothetical protein JRQ81_001846 [Phrynocephalus forsythii]|uniref:Uncharacterized protein n=1 Tax=Phrynocephalus forsythii TaxID=171643 RepID=A0A9Q0YB86_9SAUR|nr:hypothetical protein JRQ81_001846 [Phrynocephalus forsythii]